MKNLILILFSFLTLMSCDKTLPELKIINSEKLLTESKLELTQGQESFSKKNLFKAKGYIVSNDYEKKGNSLILRLFFEGESNRSGEKLARLFTLTLKEKLNVPLEPGMVELISTNNNLIISFLETQKQINFHVPMGNRASKFNLIKPIEINGLGITVGSSIDAISRNLGAGCDCYCETDCGSGGCTSTSCKCKSSCDEGACEQTCNSNGDAICEDNC